MEREKKKLVSGVGHRTRSAPSFISWACAVDLSKRDWKSAPPCSQAMLMVDRKLQKLNLGKDERLATLGAQRVQEMSSDVVNQSIGAISLLNNEGNRCRWRRMAVILSVMSQATKFG